MKNKATEALDGLEYALYNQSDADAVAVAQEALPILRRAIEPREVNVDVLKKEEKYNMDNNLIPANAKYKMGDRLRKKGKKGQWQGRVVGFYSATHSDIGYAIESERELGSVRIYPEKALEPVPQA